MSFNVFILVICFLVSLVSPQKGSFGSGTDGNLRLCVVEGRGSYRRASKFCPVLEAEGEMMECVIGTDRLDCLRRMSKGTVDFGVFSPEDLIAAQWANLDVLVTNEIRKRQRPFESSIVAVINKRLLDSNKGSVSSILRNSTLCHPGANTRDLHQLSDTISEYLETVVTQKSCKPELTIEENRVLAMANFFGKACKPGDWVPDDATDIDLKTRYSSLCAACSGGCDGRSYRGEVGALNCLTDGAGDFLWDIQDDVESYFGLFSNSTRYAAPDKFAYLCKDGSSQPLDTRDPCVWINRPWPVIVAKRKAAQSVLALVSSLTAQTAVEARWAGALTALLELSSQPEGITRAPLDHLARAVGFREAYGQAACNPPRHITFCTTSLLEQNKCEWLTEAGAVYGIRPPLQCHYSPEGRRGCLKAVQDGVYDVTGGDADWLVTASRDYKLTPLLHEMTPIVEKMSNVVAYVRKDSEISKMADLRGKRASFPRFDGYAWNSVLRYLMKQQDSCSEISDYFSQVCAPGIEKLEVSKEIKESFTKNCYKEGDNVLDGEISALRSLVEGKSDVAFVSMETYNLYKEKQIQETWARDIIDIQPICPEENKIYCFISWSSIGHVFARSNHTSMREKEIITVFTKLDQLFGRNQPFHTPMFSMYGPYNHQINVLFHNSTKNLATEAILETYPYSRFNLNFERTLRNITADRCQISEMARAFAASISPAIILVSVSVLLGFSL